ESGALPTVLTRRKWYSGWDSNPHCPGSKPGSSANWDTGVKVVGHAGIEPAFGRLMRPLGPLAPRDLSKLSASDKSALPGLAYFPDPLNPAQLLCNSLISLDCYQI